MEVFRKLLRPKKIGSPVPERCSAFGSIIKAVNILLDFSICNRGEEESSESVESIESVGVVRFEIFFFLFRFVRCIPRFSEEQA